MKGSLAIILVLLLTVGILTGCGPNADTIREDFSDILDQPASEETIKEATDYLDKYLSKVDKEYAGVMIHNLEHYILGFDQEGILYTDWINKYQKYLGPELQEYYEIMVREQETLMAEDAVLKLSWQELAQRAYEFEQLIQANKEYILLIDDYKWIYGKYINAMVMGTTGTPIFDYKTHAFSEAARTSYAAFVNTYPDSTVTWALIEYFTYLNSIGYTMNYEDPIASKLFFDTCDWLVTEAGKRVLQQ